MTRRQSKNQWSGDIATHPATKIPSTKIRWKFLASIFWDQEGILLINYLPKGQNINAEYYSSQLVHFKDILKEKSPREFHQGDLVLEQCPVSLGTCNPEETGLPGFPVS
jgi:hypothetical protein